MSIDQKNDLANLSSDSELNKVKKLLRKGALSQIANIMVAENITMDDLAEYLELPEETPQDRLRGHLRRANNVEKWEQNIEKAQQVRRTKAVARRAPKPAVVTQENE